MKGKTRKKLTKREKSQTRWGYFFIAPCIIGLLVFNFGPMLYSLAISFTDWDVISEKRFVGLANYQELLGDPLFWQSLKVTLKYTLISVPLVVIIPFLVAMLLNSKVKGISVYRSIFYIPSIVPAVASAAIWQFIYNPLNGVLNTILRALGFERHNFLGDPKEVLFCIAVMAVWASGNTVVIYLAGLQGVSAQLYEAVEIDGGGAFAKFRAITVPMMTPIIFYNLVTSMIGALQTFTQAYVMTDGGPYNASLFYSLYVYKEAFSMSRMGYASALSWILFIIVAALTAVLFKTSNKWVYEEGEN